ncbi:hypothetical protein FCL49_11170 [Serratia proteamaculans]|uniref:hypothetical protein n=1 Tax=Serratia proteamaculans TaxID=28151 RepID=UPI0015771988|nr:hypothetical protein [Serratia proteamaculans]NTX79459.1 hypothetical protein [Serratia proteamaculans]NTZ28661.1 hypothetical protein [Serratia proteamaculans]
MRKIIRPAIIFLAIIATAPFLSGIRGETSALGFSAPLGASTFVITLATFYAFVTFSLKVFDFFDKK